MPDYIDGRYDNPGKVYVDVTVLFHADGRMEPQSITWEDGRVFEIEEILGAQKAASLKAGGCGLRFTCRILGKSTFLFFEDDRFFVERR